MAKQDLKTLSVDELEALKTPIDEDQVKARKALQLAQARVTRNINKLKLINLEIESRQEQTLESMLETYIASGENSVGYKWLNNKTWKGDWKDTGMAFQGSYWPETNQRQLSVRLASTDSDEKLTNLEAILAEVMPVIKAGAYDEKRGKLKLMSKGVSVPLSELKILNISDSGLSQYANWHLAQTASGEWLIFDSYTAKHDWGRARLVGTLRECLEEIRRYLNTDEPTSEDDD